MYIFTKTIAGILVNTNNDNTIKGGGGVNNEDEIVPLGLIFINKSHTNKVNHSDESIDESFDDIKKLYKKVIHRKTNKKPRKK